MNACPAFNLSIAIHRKKEYGSTINFVLQMVSNKIISDKIISFSDDPSICMRKRDLFMNNINVCEVNLSINTIKCISKFYNIK